MNLINQENAMSRFQKINTSRTLASFLTAGAIASVMVLSTMSSAWAADRQADATPTAKQSAKPRPSDWEAQTGTLIRTNAKDLDPIVVYPGAVHAAGDAQWTDSDTSAPELPMARG